MKCCDGKYFKIKNTHLSNKLSSLSCENNIPKFFLFFSLILTQILTFANYSIISPALAQTPLSEMRIDFHAIEISETGEVKGKIIADNPAEPKQATVKAIGIGQTSIVCLDNEAKKYQVKNSGPFLVSGQSSVQISNSNSPSSEVAFVIYLKPAVGNVNCDQSETTISEPSTNFSNLEVTIF